MLKPPEVLGRFKYLMAWHPRMNTDAARIWLRHAIRETGKALSSALSCSFNNCFAPQVNEDLEVVKDFGPIPSTTRSRLHRRGSGLSSFENVPVRPVDDARVSDR